MDEFEKSLDLDYPEKTMLHIRSIFTEEELLKPLNEMVDHPMFPNFAAIGTSKKIDLHKVTVPTGDFFLITSVGMQLAHMLVATRQLVRGGYLDERPEPQLRHMSEGLEIIVTMLEMMMGSVSDVTLSEIKDDILAPDRTRLFINRNRNRD